MPSACQNKHTAGTAGPGPRRGLGLRPAASPPPGGAPRHFRGSALTHGSSLPLSRCLGNRWRPAERPRAEGEPPGLEAWAWGLGLGPEAWAVAMATSPRPLPPLPWRPRPAPRAAVDAAACVARQSSGGGKREGGGDDVAAPLLWKPRRDVTRRSVCVFSTARRLLGNGRRSARPQQQRGDWLGGVEGAGIGRRRPRPLAASGAPPQPLRVPHSPLVEFTSTHTAQPHWDP